MTKYIEVEKYNNELNKIEDFICGDATYGMAFARAALNKMSAADVQPVVHCKDCINKPKVPNEKGFLICKVTGMEIYDADYCSYGEKLDGDKHDNG